MVNLAPDFTFSQSNLQDYLECPRRFYLRYVRRLLWPNREMSSESENARRILLGQTFHRLAQQKALGISNEKIQRLVANQPLEIQTWWENFQAWWENSLPAGLNGVRFAETSLTSGVAGSRLIAKYDLLVIHPSGTVTIYDWKTIAHPIKAETLTRHVQSRVYPFIFMQANATLLPGRKIAPEQITMVYWFTADPDHPQQLPYHTRQYQADQDYLTHLITEILARQDEDFTLTTNEKYCAHCVYRTYCDRRESDEGDETLITDSDNPALLFPDDWDQVSEIAY
ncbi:MAG: PD-(D/E)XK nuclease family protein [Anaerolineales bacterium]